MGGSQSKSRAVDQGDAQGPAVTLPYVRGVSEAVRRILTPLGVKVSFRPHTTLRHLLMRPKDHTAEGELTGVVKAPTATKRLSSVMNVKLVQAVMSRQPSGKPSFNRLGLCWMSCHIRGADKQTSQPAAE